MSDSKKRKISKNEKMNVIEPNKIQTIYIVWKRSLNNTDNIGSDSEIEDLGEFTSDNFGEISNSPILYGTFLQLSEAYQRKEIIIEQAEIGDVVEIISTYFGENPNISNLFNCVIDSTIIKKKIKRKKEK